MDSLLKFIAVIATVSTWSLVGRFCEKSDHIFFTPSISTPLTPTHAIGIQPSVTTYANATQALFPFEKSVLVVFE